MPSAGSAPTALPPAGTKRGILGLGSFSSPTTSGTARAFVSDGGDVTEGVYQVTVTYTDAVTVEAERGSGESQGRAYSEAGFFAENGFGESVPVGLEATELPSQAGTVVLQYEVNVPGTGQVSIRAEIQALSSANAKATPPALSPTPRRR